MDNCYCFNLTNKELFQIESDEDKNTLAKINKKRHRSEMGRTYQIIRYDKDIMCLDEYSTLGLYRSVVCDLTDKKVVVFSPPKSIDFVRFSEKNDFSDVVVEEFIEGTMINLFWEEGLDEKEGHWEISTRSVVEANAKFYKENDTFRKMFFDAIEELSIDYKSLPKKYCYSLVLQHPKNRIVVPIHKVEIYLTEVYEIVSEDNQTKVYLRTNEFNENSIFKRPEIYTSFDSYLDCERHFCGPETSYDIVGVIFKRGLERSKMRNSNYEEIRHLRGNDPKLQYIYLSLRKTGKLSMYLKLFNEHKKPFLKFRDHLHRYTKELHLLYLDCFVYKAVKFKDLPQQFKPHLFCLHKIYLDNVGTKNKIKITFNKVKDYFNDIHPSQQMYWLNYNYRDLNQKEKSATFNDNI